MFSHYIQQCASGNSEYWFGHRQSGKEIIDSSEKMNSEPSGKVPEFRWSMNWLLEKLN